MTVTMTPSDVYLGVTPESGLATTCWQRAIVLWTSA